MNPDEKYLMMDPTIATSILDTIGNTPLIKIDKIYAKLETTNPTGSIKDRLAWYLIKKAEDQGQLKKGTTILEVTSGNTGISLAMLSAIRGYHLIAIMPNSIATDKQKIMEYFGAKVILTPAKEGRTGSIKLYEKMATQLHNVWLPRQFENPDIINAHKEGIGSEIVEQMNSNIDAFVASVGSGGTLFGVAQAIRPYNPDVKIIAIEPLYTTPSTNIPGCQQFSKNKTGFIPPHILKNKELIDETIRIDIHDALQTQKTLAQKYGIFVGISSGANVFVARQIAEKYRNVVTVLPDRGERYLSAIGKK
jgi:cysteine synthase A